MHTKHFDVFIRASGRFKTKATEACWPKTLLAQVCHLLKKKHQFKMFILNLNKNAPNTITDVKNVTHFHTRMHALPHLRTVELHLSERRLCGSARPFG